MQQYCDRAGNVVDAAVALDSHGNLRNGFGIKVPLQMCDSMQRGIAEDAKRRTRTLHRDPMGRELGTSEEEEEEPRRRSKCDAATGFSDSRGVFFAADARMQAAQTVVDHLEGRNEMLRQRYCDGRAEADKARAEMIRDMASGRNAGPPGAYPYSAAAEGGGCTINGEDGTLVKQGDWLVCKPTRKNARPRADALPRTMSASDAQKIKDEAYQAMCAELTRGRSNG